ncbi:hypothetical protein FH972_014756 [Carpinus fangiana]|uniref:Cyanate lyase C-terminal domain-containing protein n=1 Tax=Carpinus fangiana TaxID=176857 RepID=A0A5N6RAI8_9ROSI|nr:hypothetical protein FH972_014756 [Carpinus fangiana]
MVRSKQVWPRLGSRPKTHGRRPPLLRRLDPRGFFKPILLLWSTAKTCNQTTTARKGHEKKVFVFDPCVSHFHSLYLSSPHKNTSRLIEIEENKAITANRLLAVKRKSGKSYSQIAEQTGLTNVYVAQLLRRQAQLKPDTAPVLRAALPDLTNELLQEMMRPPMRSYDPSLIQEPTIYRLNEAVMHFGESIKEIINEEFGDGM